MSFEPKLNSLIADRYRLVGLLGKGAKGSVFKASDSLMSRTVALKVHKSNPTEKDQVRFQLEAKALAKLKHQNIVQVSDFGLHDEQNSYLVMEFLRGKDLNYLIKTEFSQLQDYAVAVLKQICMAMGHAHEREVLHRDLKPANVIVQNVGDQGPIAKLVDFGLAKLNEDPFLTEMGIGVGTPPYMSPEQIKGKSIDQRSDIYSFGCLMFEVLTGKLPYKGKTPADTLNLHMEAPIPNLSDANQEIDINPGLEKIVRRCLEKSPEDRFQSFDEVLSQFEILESDEPKEETNTSFVEQKRLSRSKIGIIFGCTCLVLMVAALTYNLFFRKVEFKETQKPVEKFEAFEIQKVGGNDSIMEETVCHQPAISKYGLSKLRKKIGGRKIEKLTLNLSQFDGSGLSEYLDLPIKNLSISNAEITDKGLFEIAKMKELEELKLNKNANITYKGIEALAKLPKLHLISLISAEIDDKCMKAISTYPILSTLILTNNPKISTNGWRCLEQLGSLRRLELGQQELTAKDLEVFAELKQLKILRLQQVEGVSVEQIQKLDKKLAGARIMNSNYSRKDLVDYENLFPKQ